MEKTLGSGSKTLVPIQFLWVTSGKPHPPRGCRTCQCNVGAGPEGVSVTLGSEGWDCCLPVDAAGDIQAASPILAACMESQEGPHPTACVERASGHVS